jgi:hypothetical protein
VSIDVLTLAANIFGEATIRSRKAKQNRLVGPLNIQLKEVVYGVTILAITLRHFILTACHFK